MKRLRLFSALVVVLVLISGLRILTAQRPADPLASRVDQIFSRWTADTPGCAVGVALDGKVALEKAYGMADLEHDVPNAPDTIFEAGSVSKQFTAAALLLLVREGKLSLEDPVRKYIPELPDYGSPLLVRHMLNHMSGLRDWGSIEAIAGWPRTTRVYTHAHVLDIVSRQKALNFTPGSQYSYSNTGYNLAVVIVERVSGQSFAEFTRERLFAPLGMTHTSWRDDFRRIVKHRAIAYRTAAGGYAQEMPFENVHGNGGLLTTVGDLLWWNENFEHPKVGDAAFVRRQQEPGTFNDGRAGSYALGLVVAQYKGVREVGHSGATAGYRAHLSRYPDQHVSVAVLCNAASANAPQFAHAVSDLYLGSAIRETQTDAPAPREAPASTFHPTAAQLEAFAGTYTSDEAETTFGIAVEGGALVLKRRPDTKIVLTPTTEDAFSAGSLGTIHFHRNAGHITELSVSEERVFDLRFRRTETTALLRPRSVDN
jgi:CubicO group peptidase (beta-lactamase class C family)